MPYPHELKLKPIPAENRQMERHVSPGTARLQDNSSSGRTCKRVVSIDNDFRGFSDHGKLGAAGTSRCCVAALSDDLNLPVLYGMLGSRLQFQNMSHHHKNLLEPVYRAQSASCKYNYCSRRCSQATGGEGRLCTALGM